MFNLNIGDAATANALALKRSTHKLNSPDARLKMIVLVAAEKGGVGKSTIASNLAVYLAHQEVDVVLLDTDAQATCARFVERSFIGSQTQGYLLVMSGFFRPALMVLGLVASNALLYPCTAYLNEAFLTQFRSLQADSVTGLFSLACYIAVYCFVTFTMYMLLFGLPQALPDNILRWIGAGVGDLGEKGMANKLEGTASAQARQAAVLASSRGAATQEMRRRSDLNRTDKHVGLDRAELNQEAASAVALGDTGQSTILPPAAE